MTDQPATPGPASPRLEALARYAPHLAAGLLAAAALFAVVPLVLLVRSGFDEATRLPLFWWALVCAAATVTCAADLLASGGEAPGRRSPLGPAERLRRDLLALGAALGFATAVFGLALPFTSYAETFSGGLKQWRREPAALVWTGAAFLGGLVLMFVSLQLARGVERTSAGLRVFLYAYNAALTTLLLMLIFALLNVLAYSRVGPFQLFAAPFDWTSTGLYTLSDGSKNLLGGLKQPVKVYVLMTRDDPATGNVDTLLRNARAVTDQISWETLSRDLNRKTLNALLEKYPVGDPYGLLVVYGTEPNTNWEFIPRDDIYVQGGQSFDPRDPQSKKFTFKGENALMKAIVYLSEGKSKSVVYFTQGNGEMDLNDRGRGRGDASVSSLRDRIARGNYEVKELRLGAGAKAVPEDAAVVVVARPAGYGQPMAPEAVTALRDYLAGTGRKAKGTMVVLLDVAAQRDGRMVATGLEPLLAEYGVQANNDRVLSLQSRPPTLVLGMANPRGTNPVAAAFSQGGMPSLFGFEDARTVAPAPAGPGGRFTAETLVVTVPGAPVWAETDLAADPAALVGKVRGGSREELIKKLTPAAENPLSLAVAVSEGGGPDPSLPPGHPSTTRGAKPRIVVFGDASWVANTMLESQFRDLNAELFTNCLSWLRERPDVGRQAPDKEREDYSMNLTEDQVSRAKYLPTFLILAAVLGLAGGVWVVRRR